jgi:hypothetical protein
MIRWPVQAGKAIARLFGPLQDVDIFVEDQGDEAFYTELFSKAAGNSARIAKVVGLGGCAEVIEASKTYQSKRKALFLIDGDLPWVRGDGAPAIPRLYRLTLYCIENAILIPRAIVEVAAEEAGCSEKIASQKLDLQGWNREVIGLVELFIRYAVLNQVDPSVRTVSGALGGVLVSEPGKLPVLCPHKTQVAINALDAEIRARLENQDADARLAAVRENVGKLKNRLAPISGKCFLLPLLLFRVRAVADTKLSKANLRFRLARKCGRAELFELSAALRCAA